MEAPVPEPRSNRAAPPQPRAVRGQAPRRPRIAGPLQAKNAPPRLTPSARWQGAQAKAAAKGAAPYRREPEPCRRRVPDLNRGGLAQQRVRAHADNPWWDKNLGEPSASKRPTTASDKDDPPLQRARKEVAKSSNDNIVQHLLNETDSCNVVVPKLNPLSGCKIPLDEWLHISKKVDEARLPVAEPKTSAMLLESDEELPRPLASSIPKQKAARAAKNSSKSNIPWKKPDQQHSSTNDDWSHNKWSDYHPQRESNWDGYHSQKKSNDNWNRHGWSNQHSGDSHGWSNQHSSASSSRAGTWFRDPRTGDWKRHQ